MGLKKTNQLEMFGVLPSQGADPIPVGKIPDGGTQVVVSASPGVGTVLFYTVTAGKTLYLSLWVFSAYSENAARQNISFFVTNAADGFQWSLFNPSILPDTVMTKTAGFMPPLEIPAGYKIKTTIDAADAPCRIFIHGYEL